MAGEMLTFNPRRRRNRRKRKARGHRRARTTNRRRRRAMNPVRHHRRRRHNARRRRNRTYNPRIPFLGEVNFGGIASGTVGYFGARYGAGFALGFVPKDWTTDPNNASMVRIGIKAVVGLAILPAIAKAMFKGSGLAKFVALGGGIAVAEDIFTTYAQPQLDKAGIHLADYGVRTLTNYDLRTLTGAADQGGASSAYGAGAFAGAAY